jgi:hypothetical protein
MLRLLIKDITVEKPLNPKQLLVHIRWQGGACTDLTVPLPPNIADRLRYPAAVVDLVRELARSLPDVEIAAQFNREARASATGKPYTAKMIQWIRRCHCIRPAALKKPDELTVRQAAEHFDVTDSVIYYWIERRLLHARRLNGGMPYWITLNAADEEKLRDRVRSSGRIRNDQASRNCADGGAL